MTGFCLGEKKAVGEGHRITKQVTMRKLDPQQRGTRSWRKASCWLVGVVDRRKWLMINRFPFCKIWQLMKIRCIWLVCTNTWFFPSLSSLSLHTYTHARTHGACWCMKASSNCAIIKRKWCRFGNTGKEGSSITLFNNKQIKLRGERGDYFCFRLIKELETYCKRVIFNYGLDW